MSPPPENTPELETARLWLRRFRTDDAAAMLPVLADERVNTYLPWFPVRTLAQARTHLRERFLAHYSSPVGYRYAVCVKPDPRPVGWVTVTATPEHDLGYGLAAEHWGQGIATEAARAVVDRVRHSGWPYVTATHDRDNPASGRVMAHIQMGYRYSYVEQWQPKDVSVTFRMWQLDLDGPQPTYRGYWDRYPDHFVESV